MTTIGSVMPGIRSVWMDSNAIIYAGGAAVIYARSYSGTGAFTVIAGSTASSTAVDGIGTNARFGTVYGMTGDTADGSLYFTDYTNRIVHKMNTATYAVSTIAGNGVSGTGGNEGPALSASLINPYSIYINTVGGELLVTDYGANNIK